MLYRGTAALEMWCRRVCEGYPGVEIKNMGESWRDGLAFCAILHRYRPDLINWQECRKGDTFRNCSLAFSVAESCLSIPSLLDPQDMVCSSQLDRLSILTYLSEMYHRLEGKSKPGSIIKRKNSVDSGVAEEGSLYSSASSGTGSPVRDWTENKITNKEKYSDCYNEAVTYQNFIVSDENIAVTSSSDNQSSEDTEKTVEVKEVKVEDQEVHNYNNSENKEPVGHLEDAVIDVKHKTEVTIYPTNSFVQNVRRRPKKSLSSVVNRRLVKSMHEITTELELTSKEETAFSVGFRKFKDLTQSTTNLSKLKVKTTENLKDNPIQPKNRQVVSVMTQTEEENLKVSVVTQTEEEHLTRSTLHKRPHYINQTQSPKNNKTPAQQQYNTKAMCHNYNTTQPEIYRYNTTQSIIQQYNTAQPTIQQYNATHNVHKQYTNTKHQTHNPNSVPKTRQDPQYNTPLQVK